MPVDPFTQTQEYADIVADAASSPLSMNFAGGIIVLLLLVLAVALPYRDLN